MEKVYISGAIAHHDLDERKSAFSAAESFLRKCGVEPINPFKNGLSDDAPWREHMRRDIGLLVGCDSIYMLRGWELSKGAKLELDVASSCGLRVLFEHDNESFEKRLVNKKMRLMKNAIKRVMNWLRGQRCVAKERRAARREMRLLQDARHVMQIREYGGELWLSYGGQPVLPVDGFRWDVPTTLDVAREAYARYRKEEADGRH